MTALSLLFATAGNAAAPEEPLVAARLLREDLAYLRKTIAQTHPDVAVSADPAALEQAYAGVERALDRDMTAAQAWTVLATLNPVFADAHLFVGFADWRADVARQRQDGGLFPFEVQVKPDGEVFIRAALGGAATPLAGARIAAIDGVDARRLAADMMARVHGDTPAFRARLLSQRWWLYYWRMFGARPDYALTLAQPAQSALRIPASDAVPQLLAGEGLFEQQFKLALLPGRAAVLTVGTFSWSDKPRFYAFAQDAFARIRAAGVQTLLIDVRANGGGDDDMWQQGLLRYLADRPYRLGSDYRKKVLRPDPAKGELPGQVIDGQIEQWIAPQPDEALHFSGKTYVLVGASTYSSAVLFSHVMQDFGLATLAGSGASTRAVSTGGIQKFTLPHSGLALWVPRFWIRRPSGASAPALLTPDILLDDDPYAPDAAIDVLLQRERARASLSWRMAPGD